MKTKIIGGVVTIGVFPRRRRNCGWDLARGSPSSAVLPECISLLLFGDFVATQGARKAPGSRQRGLM